MRLPVTVWRRLSRRPTFGVCYHVVSDTRLPHLKHYPPLTTQQFEEDLATLGHHFNVVGYEDLLHRRSAAPVALDNTLMLTFDDGFAQCATVVRPILVRHGFSAVFFVVTDLIDNRVMFRESKASLCIDSVLRLPTRAVDEAVHDLVVGSAPPWDLAGTGHRRQGFGLAAADLGDGPEPRLRPLLHWLLTARPEDEPVVDRLCERLGVDVEGYLSTVQPYLSAQQIRQLHADGFTIGAHTRTHRRLETLSRNDAENEIVESCRVVRELTGQESVPCAFPYNGGGLDRAWLGQIRERHDFVGLFFDTGGLCDDEPLVVQRVFGERVTEDRSIDRILRRAWARRVA